MIKSWYITIVSLLSAIVLANNADAAPKVTQAATIDFPIHKVVVLAVEELNHAPVMMFHDQNGILYSIPFGEEFLAYSEFAYSNSFLRFERLDIKELLSPLILAIAVMPGGSDWTFEAKIIGEQDGEIRVLNPDPIRMNILDGLYLGAMTPQEYGLLTWTFRWEDEAHYDPHRYTLRLYAWERDTQQFILTKEIVTTKKYATGCEALREYNLPCENLRDRVIHPEEDLSTLGIEEKMLSPIPEN